MNLKSTLLRYIIVLLSVLWISATALAAPVIQVQPVSQTVNETSPVTFSVSATGTGTLTYQWQKDGVTIPGATSNVFSLLNARPWHIGDYIVKISDSSGLIASSSAALSISNKTENIWKGLLYYWPMNGDAKDKGLLNNDFVVKNAISSVDKNGSSDSC